MCQLSLGHPASDLAASMFSSSEDSLCWGEEGEISFGGERMVAVARWLAAGAVGDGITTHAPCLELEVVSSCRLASAHSR